MASNKNIFEEDEEINRIIFVEETGPVLEERPQRVSDPPPRPLPKRIQGKSKNDSWVPGAESTKRKKPSFSKLQPLALRTAVTTGVVASLSGIGYLVYLVFEVYAG